MRSLLAVLALTLTACSCAPSSTQPVKPKPDSAQALKDGDPLTCRSGYTITAGRCVPDDSLPQ